MTGTVSGVMQTVTAMWLVVGISCVPIVVDRGSARDFGVDSQC